MAYTAEPLVNDTYERLRTINPQIGPSIIPRLAILVPSALRILPSKIRERFGQDEAALYQKSYTITLTSGEGDLTAATNLTSEPMILSEISWVTHPDAASSTNGDGRLRRLGSSSALDMGRSQEYAYFAVEGASLFTMMNNDRTALNGDATVWAAFPPDITNVKFSHEPMLLELMVELSQGMAKAA